MPPISLPCSVLIDDSMKLAWPEELPWAPPCRLAAISSDPHGGLDVRGQMDGIRRWLLLDAENDRRLALETGIASFDGRREGHVGDLPQ